MKSVISKVGKEESKGKELFIERIEIHLSENQHRHYVSYLPFRAEHLKMEIQFMSKIFIYSSLVSSFWL